MPLVAHSNLPSFERLKSEGQEVLSIGRANTQNIRELHIGLLNMMPDAALQATERQFLRLIGSCNRIAQFYVYPFTFPEIPRGEDARAYIENYYSDFTQLKQEGLDALIISGASPVQSDITQEPFWQPLKEVVHWASEHVCSVMCSCLATHSVVKILWNFERYRLPQKKWGVYSHRTTSVDHPLVVNINTCFDAPRSHIYGVSVEQFEKAGLMVLAASEQANLYLGVSPDGFRFVLFQGHPEYDTISLLKEYHREIKRFIEGIRTDYPPLPKYYFRSEALQLLDEYRSRVEEANGDNSNLPEFPESEVYRWVDNTWTDTGKSIINNWLGLVYQVSHRERNKAFMEGISPQNPLNLAINNLALDNDALSKREPNRAKGRVATPPSHDH